MEMQQYEYFIVLVAKFYCGNALCLLITINVVDGFKLLFCIHYLCKRLWEMMWWFMLTTLLLKYFFYYDLCLRS